MPGKKVLDVDAAIAANRAGPIVASLENLMTDEFLSVWVSLNERQQLFFVTWLNNGFRGAEAYAQVYDLTDRAQAGSYASRALSTSKFKKLREVVQQSLYMPIERAQQVEVDALEDPDPAIRLRAAKQLRERMAALAGPGKPGRKTEVNAENVQINQYGESGGVGPVEELLNRRKKK